MKGDSNKILVVDDDPRLARMVKRYLSLSGFEVLTANNGAEMRVQLEQGNPGMVLMDLNFPNDNGFELANYVQANSDAGIIFLTASDEIFDRVAGLEMGGDDYVIKPFEERELLARIRSVFRRLEKVSPDEATVSGDSPVQFAGWTYDASSYHLATTNSEQVELTSTEHHLLQSFLRSPGRVLSREQLLDAVGGRDWHPNDRSIDVLVGKLRRKLRDPTENPSIIRTIRGSGYKFIASVNKE